MSRRNNQQTEVHRDSDNVASTDEGVVQMNRSEAATNTTAGPVDPPSPEMPGLISETDGVAYLQCVSDKHILAKIHPGNILKIKDRRCKIEVVFDLSALLRNGGIQAQ